MRLIDADALIKFLDERSRYLGITTANACNFKDIVRMQPTVDENAREAEETDTQAPGTDV